MKKWIKAAVIILNITMILCSSQALAGKAAAEGGSAPEELKNLYAQSAVLIDADSGRVLFEKNGQEQRPMASTTKIMTCILALELGSPEDEVTASANAASQPKVHLGVGEGERFRLRDLLYSLMLESHNDAAVMIAEHIGGSVQGFADKMNAKAAELGCEQTYFITPNGLDSQDGQGVHSTTAEELARIMRYCILISPEKEEFLKITGTMSHVFSTVDGSRSFSCVNHNAFLGMMDGALSGKTGFTNNAGYCYVGALQKDGKTLIVALLACGWPNNKSYKWSDTKKIMQYGLENYEYRNVHQELKPDPVPVEGGVPQSGRPKDPCMANLYIDDKDTSEMAYLLRADESVAVEYEAVKYLEAPVEKGQEVGVVRYLLDGEILREFPIKTAEEIDKIDYTWCLKHILSRFFVQ